MRHKPDRHRLKLCTTIRAEDVTDTLELALAASGCDQAPRPTQTAPAVGQRTQLYRLRTGRVDRGAGHEPCTRRALPSPDPRQDRALAPDTEPRDPTRTIPRFEILQMRWQSICLGIEANHTPLPLISDPMLRSRLLFAGANQTLAGHPLPADLSDGILTAYQASTLNLQGTELRPKRGSTKFDDRVWTLTPSASLPTNH